MSAPPPPKGGGMSLYANLLNPKADSTASTISSAPMLYDVGEKDDVARKDANPALRFQPIRRPQAAQKKPSKPATFPKPLPAPTSSTSSSDPAAANAPPPAGHATPPAAAAAQHHHQQPQQPQRSTLADWAAAGADAEFVAAAGEKRQRGGRKAAKKRNNKKQSEWQRETDWDEMYDPARPTNVDEYLRSEERVREVQEWKAVLYAHRQRRRQGSKDGSDSEEETAAGGANQFAPPTSYAFAPPPASPPAAPSSVPDDATGDDAYARRLALSGMGAAPPAAAASHSPTPPPPPQDAATICRPPVRYETPPVPASDTMDMDSGADDGTPGAGLGTSSAPDSGTRQPRTSLPGQQGFAQRLMSKYGWTAGAGLGAAASGILDPLAVQVSRRRKKPDAAGGALAEPGGARGRIVGGTLPAAAGGAEQQAGRFGAMSEVVVLRNMLEGMEGSLADEIESGLGQEIGEECGDKYGRVERLYIDVDGRQVFIKFTDAVSALRAVNALEGRVFNGNTIAARFWDAERFERGEYK